MKVEPGKAYFNFLEGPASDAMEPKPRKDSQLGVFRSLNYLS